MQTRYKAKEPRFKVEWRKFDCHPETCNHDDHFPWYVWDLKDSCYVIGFSDKKHAEYVAGILSIKNEKTKKRIVGTLVSML